MSSQSQAVLQAAAALIAGGEGGAMATVVSVTGSAPQAVGARLLLRRDGTMLGTVGGGAIEHAVLAALRHVLQTRQSVLFERDLGRDLGMCCGGTMQVFLEVLEAAEKLWLFGAGHVAQATAPLARGLGFQVCVVDDREELTTAERFPDCELHLRDPVDCLRSAPLSERDWLLIMTHDHRLDEETLAQALEQQVKYVGLVGSRRKVFRLLQRIAARGRGLVLNRLYAPVGLDIGAVGPEEIAVSIVAELVAVRRGAGAPHLRVVDSARLERLLAEGEAFSE